MRLVTADVQHGEQNRAIVRGWLAKWTPVAHDAARALGVLFATEGIRSLPLEPALERVVTRQQRIVKALGVEPEPPP